MDNIKEVNEITKGVLELVEEFLKEPLQDTKILNPVPLTAQRAKIILNAIYEARYNK